MLVPEERAALAPAVRRLYLLDVGYQRLSQELYALVDPDPADPVPRHFQHLGASFAVTARAYARAGGLPPLRHAEDVALFDALLRTGARVRHSYRVRAWTSARLVGRAPRGLSDALGYWTGEGESVAAAREGARSIERRAAVASRLRTLWTSRDAPDADLVASTAALAEVSAGALRHRLATARTLGALLVWGADRSCAGDTASLDIAEAVASLRVRIAKLRAGSAPGPAGYAASL